MNKVYQIITDKIIKALEEGTVPWRKPWMGIKINYVSKKSYRGVNLFLLERPGEYLTWNQINKLNGKVKKGSKSEIVVFYKTLKKTVEEENPKTGEIEEVEKNIPLLRYYRVFHIDDVEGIESKIENVETDPIEEGEKIVDGYKDKITLEIKTSDRAFYRPSQDKVVVPKLGQYKNPAEFYSTIFHEFGHSTGHWTRLKRYKSDNLHIFASESYSKEELIAELTSCMLCSAAGLDTSETFNNSTAYIAGWLKKLKNDKKLIIQASNEAQKACDLILKGKVKENKKTA